MSRRSLVGTLALGLWASASCAALGEEMRPNEGILVEGSRPRDLFSLPDTAVSVTAADIATTVNAVNTEDALKYLPSLLVRKRHIGDTQAPLATRTSGVGASARSVIYADGVLLSALIGNNNTSASPRWGMVAPEDIARIDVLYGPFSAAFPGNSIGAVVSFTTRMPTTFEARAKAAFVWQDFSQYATDGIFPAKEFAGQVGDRTGRFAWRLGVNHVDSKGQPLSYVTVARPTATGLQGQSVTGATPDQNRTGAPIWVIGAGGLERHLQDTITGRAVLEFESWRGAYSFGFFRNSVTSQTESYLRDAQGLPVYAGNVNFGNAPVAIPASTFNSGRYVGEQRHWMQNASLSYDDGGPFDAMASISLYRFGRDMQGNPGSASALQGGAGALTSLAGTGWLTGDVGAGWHPSPAHALRAGVHFDRFTLTSPKYASNAWQSLTPGVLTADARGRTRTFGLWLEHTWAPLSDVHFTLGARQEWWRADRGRNFSVAPALDIDQPARDNTGFSPKATLVWNFAPAWDVTVSFGRAYRFPTVTELYQTITTGLTLTVPDPRLRPERATSAELALGYADAHQHWRAAVFHETIKDALLSQSAPLVPGNSALFSYVQNVPKTRSWGIELSGAYDNVLPGLDLSGSVTFVDPRLIANPIFPATIGKQLPQVPKWRATAVVTYRPAEPWAITFAARASSRMYGTIDNSDGVSHTFQGFEGYVVMDARIRYALTPQLHAALGVDHLSNRKYFLFHPFPQRTVVMEISYAY